LKSYKNGPNKVENFYFTSAAFPFGFVSKILKSYKNGPNKVENFYFTSAAFPFGFVSKILEKNLFKNFILYFDFY